MYLQSSTFYIYIIKSPVIRINLTTLEYEHLDTVSMIRGGSD